MMQNIVIIATLGLTVIFVFIGAAAFTAASANSLQTMAKIYKNRFTETADMAMSDMFLTMSPGMLFVINLLALILIPLLVHTVFDIWVLTASVAAILMVLPGLFWSHMRQKRLNKLEAQLPDAFMMISSGLQSGASFPMALEDMARQAPEPLAQEFGLLVKRMRLGVPMEDGLIELEKRIPLTSFVMASSAIRISREVGGNLVETISNMARTLRRKHQMEGKIDSLTAQGRTQGRFMSALPILLGIALSFLEPEAMQQLYTTRNGLLILTGMVVMQVMGFVFIRKLTSIDS
ncbi:MAG: secretion system protein F [Porticoccaceae bacterium]|jgi:tight adherence protein B|nr:secretion system protein F [Porticoccaceae bacterium]MBT7376506.1 secretion system protein F [Porticoccaceae bacterium]